MRPFLKSTLTAILVTGVAALPLATAITVVTADAVYAKSDKSKGGGGGGGRGNGGGGGRGQSASAGGHGGQGGGNGRGRASRGNDPVAGFLNRLVGKPERTRTATARPARPQAQSGRPASGGAVASVTRTAPVTSVAPPSRGQARRLTRGEFHPSELGNMNGALNASMNAVLAHARNGNTNGPVGAMALLALSDSRADGADEVVTTYEQYAALQEALGEDATVEDYYQSIADARDAARNQDVEDALLTLAVEPENADALQVLADNGYGGIADPGAAYEADLLAAETAARDPDIDGAIDSLGGDSQAFTDVPDNPYDADDYTAAQDDLQAQSDAEANLLALWNKNPGDVETADGEESPQQRLLDLARDRFDGYEDQIDALAADPLDSGDDTPEDGETAEDASGCGDIAASCEDDLAAITE